MRVEILLTEGGPGHVAAEKVVWKWQEGNLRVYAGNVLRLEAPREKVVAVILTEAE